MTPTAIDRLIQLLAKLPGLGPRSARRVALHLIKRKAGLDDYKILLRDMSVPTLRRVGMRQAMKGRTTAAEVLRVT